MPKVKEAVSMRSRGIVVLLAACACTWMCGPHEGIGETRDVVEADDCDDDLPSDSLPAYAEKCAAAIGEDVPGFNCDDGKLVPEDHLTGSGYGNQDCDRPNVLSGVCDPGSRFQVLKQTADVAIVAHCRKKGHGAGQYGDIAVIQYNQKNGATCFYQALGTLSAQVTAPREGNGSGKFPWKDPADTAAIHCVGCHDNGPFVRSPYLAQLRDEPTNRLPGTNPGTGPWDRRFSWNKTLPYRFVGNDFQSWKAFSVSVAGTGGACLACHRLGFSQFDGRYQASGTAQDFGPLATDVTQSHKNPHSADSPIWMTPGQIAYDAGNHAEAQAVAACASAIVARGNDPNAPNPPTGCQAVQFGSGDTCRQGPITAVVNGATQSAPTSERTDEVGELGPCMNGDCPPGFCYWRTLHGPFWQTAPSTLPPEDDSYRGSFARIYGENGVWKYRVFSDSRGGPDMPPPGGTLECTVYNEIPSVPDTRQCFASMFDVADPDGNTPSGLRNATVGGTDTANVLSGLIGNVAQTNVNPQETPDYLRVEGRPGAVRLSFQHASALPAPLKTGPLKGESWTNGCNGWNAAYIVRDVHSTSDVQLVPAAQAKKARCFITGVTGAWSRTRNSGLQQPYAEIYVDNGKNIRFRVSPTSGDDRVGAYASCIELK